MILSTLTTFSLGVNEARADRYTEAGENKNFDQALKLLLNKGETYRSAEDWLLIGNILQDKDKLDEAIYMYKQAIEKDPKYYKAH